MISVVAVALMSEARISNGAGERSAWTCCAQARDCASESVLVHASNNSLRITRSILTPRTCCLCLKNPPLHNPVCPYDSISVLTGYFRTCDKLIGASAHPWRRDQASFARRHNQTVGCMFRPRQRSIRNHGALRGGCVPIPAIRFTPSRATASRPMRLTDFDNGLKPSRG